ncbi:hypothetical protein [Longispora albida]|uniref:hypothetical protein n=1 Tax=Longispora albida TaxID=203523 RepID=UPI0003822B3D|nr:hypothetical protein [Longispora albida]
MIRRILLAGAVCVAAAAVSPAPAQAVPLYGSEIRYYQGSVSGPVIGGAYRACRSGVWERWGTVTPVFTERRFYCN